MGDTERPGGPGGRSWGGALDALVTRLSDLPVLVRRLLRRIDPAGRDADEPLALLPLVVFGIALATSVEMFWRYKFQPMQDYGHHVGLSAVVADWGRPGSLYTELYDAPDPLNANSLLYTFAGYLGRIIGVTTACQVGMTLYVAGVPLALLYGLRVFGRSPWPAVLSVPLVYNMNFIAGFANLLFAAPFMVLVVPVFYRLLTAPTWKRFVASALLFIAIFLSHAHVYLWTGALTVALTLGVFVVRLGQRQVDVVRRIKRAFGAAGIALASALPSLLIFLRWYDWAFGEGRESGSVTVVTKGLDEGFDAYFKPLPGLFQDLYAYAGHIFRSEEDLVIQYELVLLGLVALSAGRLFRSKRPPVLELAFVMTFASYFYMPEAIATNPVVGSRQIGIALWFFAAIACPVPKNVSRLARWAVIGGILYITYEYLHIWHDKLVEFEHTEAAGLEYVLEPAPYRQRMHYVKVKSDWSDIFQWRPVWHVEKFYMADKLGQVADNPAIVSTSSIRYREGVDPHRITVHGSDWPSWQTLWDNYELVLVRGWDPVPSQLDLAKKHAVRVRKQGDWELWRKKGAWQQGLGEAPDL